MGAIRDGVDLAIALDDACHAARWDDVRAMIESVMAAGDRRLMLVARMVTRSAQGELGAVWWRLAAALDVPAMLDPALADTKPAPRPSACRQCGGSRRIRVPVSRVASVVVVCGECAG